MTPTSGGRHCTACQKTVVDFTQKTDAEILAHLALVSNSSCGRFRADQLARPLLPAAPVNRWRSWLGAVLAVGGVLGAGRAAGQSLQYGGGPEPVAAAPGGATSAAEKPAGQAEQPTAPLPAGRAGSLTVHGEVRDASDRLPLPGVTVLLPGTTIGTSTDANGAFTLTVPDGAEAQLLFSFIGYHRVSQPIRELNGQLESVLLQPDSTSMLMGTVVAGIAVQRPYLRHPRALYHWAKYQLTRPFRRGY